MNGKIKKLGALTIVIGLLLAVLILFNGCKKSQPTPPPAPSAEAVSATMEQTSCPVMGRAINKDIFTVYKGKKVYFCCPGCKPEFEKNPEKYIAKLPQFKK